MADVHMADGRVIQVPDYVLQDEEYLPSMSREPRLTRWYVCGKCRNVWYSKYGVPVWCCGEEARMLGNVKVVDSVSEIFEDEEADESL